MEALKTRVSAKTERRRAGPEEMLVVFREKQADGSWKHDYSLSNASVETALPEFARVFNAEHRVEQCLQRAKGEAGLSHYEVRTWRGWHHHQTLSLIATWFLTQEARRGKNVDACDHGAADPLVHRGPITASPGLRRHGVHLSYQHTPTEAQGASATLCVEETQLFATIAD